jgi:hypothetical protein
MIILLISFCAVVAIFFLIKLTLRPPHFLPGKIDHVAYKISIFSCYSIRNYAIGVENRLFCQKIKRIKTFSTT